MAWGHGTSPQSCTEWGLGSLEQAGRVKGVWVPDLTRDQWPRVTEDPTQV